MIGVPKLHVRHLFGRVRPRTWRFEEGLDQTKARSVADVRADMVRNSEHCSAAHFSPQNTLTPTISEDHIHKDDLLKLQLRLLDSVWLKLLEKGVDRSAKHVLDEISSILVRGEFTDVSAFHTAFFQSWQGVGGRPSKIPSHPTHVPQSRNHQ